MSDDDFKDIFNDGFELIVEGDDSEIICIDCGIQAKLTEVDTGQGTGYVVNCDDDHEWDLLDYTIAWINIKDGLLKMQLDNSCCYNFVKKAKE